MGTSLSDNIARIAAALGRIELTSARLIAESLPISHAQKHTQLKHAAEEALAALDTILSREVH